MQGLVDGLLERTDRRTCRWALATLDQPLEPADRASMSGSARAPTSMRPRSQSPKRLAGAAVRSLYSSLNLSGVVVAVTDHADRVAEAPLLENSPSRSAH